MTTEIGRKTGMDILEYKSSRARLIVAFSKEIDSQMDALSHVIGELTVPSTASAAQNELIYDISWRKTLHGATSVLIGESKSLLAPVIQFEYTGDDWRAALIDLEQEKGDEIPPPIIAMLYAALYSFEKYGKSIAPTLFVAFISPKKHGKSRLSAKDVQRVAENLLKNNPNALVDTHALEHAVGDLCAFDQMRVLFQIARRIWDIDVIERIAPYLVKKKLEGVTAILAFVFLSEKWMAGTIEFKGKKMQIPFPAYSPVRMFVYPQLIEWAYNRLDPNLLDRIYRGIMPGWAPLTEDLPIEAHARETIRHAADTLVRLAEQQKRFAPQGDFFLKIPKPIAGVLGVDSIRILVDPLGMWVFPYNPNSQKYGLSFRYQSNREQRILLTTCDEGHASLLDLMLSALWYDLAVGGKETLRPPSRTREPTGSPAKEIRGASEGQPPVYRLQTRAPTHISLSGWLDWGDEEEHERIQRRAHHVRGFIRSLPPGWRASEEAIQNAAAFGIIVPDGYTFVRPHVRGQKHSEEPLPEIRSRGLATAITLIAPLAHP